MEAHISHIYASYVIDPQVYGLDASIWKTVSGTPSVTSNKYRLNAAEMISYSQYKYGEFEFNVTVPAAPTAADNRVFGLLSKALGNRARITFTFNTSGELRAQVYDKFGASLFSELIPWNAGWTNVATLFRIGWSRNAIVFTVQLPDGTLTYSTTYAAALNPISGTLNIDVLNANADNMDVSSVAVGHSNFSLPLNGGGTISSIIPGTGATNLGKAEDSPHASGDTGVAVWAKRTDTAASSAGTDGDYATLNEDASGNLWTSQGTLQSGEIQDINAVRVEPQASYTNLSASSLIYTGAGRVAGFVVNSCAAGATIKLWDNTSAATTVLLNTITFTAAVNQGPVVVTLPAFTRTTVGLYCTIAVAAMDVTIMWRQTT